MNVFELSAKLGLDTSEYDEGLDKSAEKGSSWGDKVGTALGNTAKVAGVAMTALGTASTFVGKAVADGVKDVSDYGDTIDKTSQKLGVSVEAYQKWDYVMNLAGTSMQNMGTGLKTLTNKLDDAKNGSEDAQEMFAKLGISLEDINTMSREELFENAIYGFQGMADSTERASLANDLFGKSGQELTPLFNQTAESTQELMQNLEDMGAVMSEDAIKASADYKDSLTTLQMAVTGLKNNALSKLLPQLTSIANGLTKIFAGDNGGLADIKEGINSISKTITENLPEIMDTAMEIVQTIGEAIVENLPVLLDSAIQIVEQIGTLIIDNLPMLAETGMQIIVQLATSLGDALPDLIPSVVDVIIQIATTLISNVDKLLEAGIAIIEGLIKGIVGAIPELVKKAPEIILALITAIPKALINLVKDLASMGLDVIKAIWDAIVGCFYYLKDHGGEIIDKIIEAGKEALNNIFEFGKEIVEKLWEGIKSLWGWLADNWKSMLSSIFSPSIRIDTEGLKDYMQQQGIDTLSSSSTSFAQKARENLNITVDTKLSLEPDSAELFRIVEQENRVNTKATGYNALAMTN